MSQRPCSNIMPRAGLVVLDEVPPMRPNRLLYFLGRCFPSLAQRLSIQRRLRLEGKLAALMSACVACKDRGDLECLLGQPVGLNGALFGQIVDGIEAHPDFIERYWMYGCCVDLWFINGSVANISGYIEPCAWDIARLKSGTLR